MDNPNFLILTENIDLQNKDLYKLWAYTEITGSEHPCTVEMITNARNKIINIIKININLINNSKLINFKNKNNKINKYNFDNKIINNNNKFSNNNKLFNNKYIKKEF